MIETQNNSKLLLSMKIGFTDPSTNNQINNKFFNGVVPIAIQTNLKDEDKNQVISLVTILSMKLVSLWEIKEQYRKELRNLKTELKKSPKGGNDNLHHYSIQSSGLLGWLDVYLVQIKSILDHLVKIPSPIFGYNRWNLATFGGKGQKVKKAFQNLPREYKERTKDYYEQIFETQGWIHDAIDMRDRLNHGVKGGLDLRMFEISYDENGGKFIEPMWSNEQSIEEALDIIFDSILKTSSIFCGLIFSLKLPSTHTVVCDPNMTPICQVTTIVQLKAHLEAKGINNHGFA